MSVTPTTALFNQAFVVTTDHQQLMHSINQYSIPLTEHSSYNDTNSPYKTERLSAHQSIYDKFKIPSSPGIRFFYYASPTTGSRFIRNPIRLLCKLGGWKLVSTKNVKMRCFTQCGCADCVDCQATPTCPKHLKKWKEQCWRDADKKANARVRMAYVRSTTLWRISSCCPDESYKTKVLNGKMDVMFEHWENTHPANKEFMRSYYPPEKTFLMVLVREPIEYLMSRLAIGKDIPFGKQFLPSLRKKLSEWAVTEASGQSPNPMINAQSLYMGWHINNNQSLVELLQYVRKMTLVAPTSQAELALRYMACLTGWDRGVGMSQDRIEHLSKTLGAPYFPNEKRKDNVPRGRQLMRLLPEEDRNRLKAIFFADYALYNLVNELFAKLNATLFDNCHELE